jgi:hypothetical protein
MAIAVTLQKVKRHKRVEKIGISARMQAKSKLQIVASHGIGA